MAIQTPIYPSTTTVTQTGPLTTPELPIDAPTTPRPVLPPTPTPVLVSVPSTSVLEEELVGITISFSETAKGWTSFKSFIQDGGLSLNNDYYTLKNGELWRHHFNETRNNFYDDQYDSHVDILFNEESAKVKSFGSMKYEGSQAKITQNLGSVVGGVNYSDNEYYNNEGYSGWYVESGETDLQFSGEMEFKDKEGKWFSYMKGVPVETVADLDSEEFSFQGIDILE